MTFNQYILSKVLYYMPGRAGIRILIQSDILDFQNSRSSSLSIFNNVTMGSGLSKKIEKEEKKLVFGSGRQKLPTAPLQIAVWEPLQGKL